MKIEIEISEINAASLWADHWKQQPLVERLVERLVAESGASYRAAFPFTIDGESELVAAFRDRNSATDARCATLRQRKRDASQTKTRKDKTQMKSTPITYDGETNDVTRHGAVIGWVHLAYDGEGYYAQYGSRQRRNYIGSKYATFKEAENCIRRVNQRASANTIINTSTRSLTDPAYPGHIVAVDPITDATRA